MIRGLSPISGRGTRAVLGLVTGLVIGLLVLLLWWANWLVGIRLQMTNPFYVEMPTSGNVVLVAIDDSTLQSYGSVLNWSRSRYADLLNVMIEADAQVVGFDILFAEPRDADGDTAFAQALADARVAGVRTILPVDGRERIASEDGSIQFVDELPPIPEFAEQATYISYVNAYPDADGTIRRSITTGTYNDQQRYSFSIAAYLSFFNVSATLAPNVVTITENRVELPPDVEIHLQDDGFWLHNYFGGASDETARTFPVFSFKDVIGGEISQSQFTNKIVLVGLMNAQGAVDRYITPVSRTGEMMAGVEIQANTIETLLSNAPLRAESQAAQVITILAIAILTGAITAQLRWYGMIAAAIVIFIVWGIYASTMFTLNRVVVNSLHPPIALFLTMLTSIGVRISIEIISRQRAENLIRSLTLISQQRMNLDRITPVIVDDVRQLTGVETGSLWIVNEDDEPEVTMRWGKIQAHGTIARQAHEQKQTQHAANVMAVPVIWQGRVLAVITVEIGRFRRNIQRQLERFAERMGANLDNAMLYAQTESQNQLLQGILAGSPAAVLVLDEDHTLLRYNQIFATWLQLDGDFIGKPVNALLEASHIEPDQWSEILDLLKQGNPFRREITIHGRTYLWETNRLSDGERWVIILSDVSDFAELNQLKTRMIRMASHDLKNPLGRIVGYGEMITEFAEDGELDPEQSLLFVNRIIQSAEEMNAIITDILNLEHMRSGKLSLEPHNLINIIQNATDRYILDMQEKNQTFRQEIPDDLPEVRADFNQLVQAFSNLLGNAVKYTPDGGEITLRLFEVPDGDMIRIELQDTGYGMPEDAQKNLFTEFYRVRTEATKNIKGTGLGLSLVKSVIESHEGRIWVESELNVGSTFFVELPIYRASSS